MKMEKKKRRNYIEKLLEKKNERGKKFLLNPRMSCCSKFRKGRERKEGEYECEKERKSKE